MLGCECNSIYMFSTCIIQCTFMFLCVVEIFLCHDEVHVVSSLMRTQVPNLHMYNACMNTPIHYLIALDALILFFPYLNVI